ncbi:MAG: hypothetical protein BJ554DRAFT_5059 [Olpidium bornovanus]|uniref:Chromo domain-containing protein n=1 Tax=Olpidium bornovanus TaxID=278681 RepID=A0A8H7ZJX0_9FUNG|nr:MAG: hypothetical protein BJ554DRAFT_5059 [Olpidium bornovanus]
MRAAQVVAEGDNAAPSALAGLPESADAGSAGGACGGMGETGEDGGIPSAEQVEAEGTSSDAPESPDGVGLSTADRREADRVLAKRAVGDAVECHVRLEALSACRQSLHPDQPLLLRSFFSQEMLDKIPDREHLVSKFEVQSVEGGSSGDSSRLDDVNGPAVLATPDRSEGADQQNEEEGRGNDEEEIRAKHHGIDVLSLHQLSGSPSEPECPSGEWREYLVKFKNRSYRDVEWVPSRWLVGTVSRAMLKNFWTACEGPVPEDEAFSEAYTRIDIVLCIRDEDGDETEDPEIEPDQISAVYVKWKKLPYDEGMYVSVAAIPRRLWDYRRPNWTEPPDEDEPEYANFLSAFERYKKALGVGKPKRSVQLNSRMFKELVDQPRSVEGGSLMPHQMEGLK